MIKLILYLVCGLCLLTGEVAGQNQSVVDSLTQLLEHKTGGDRYGPLYKLTFEYIDRDNKRAVVLIDQALKAALLAKDTLAIVKSNRVRGQILYKLEKNPEAILAFQSAILLAEQKKFTREYMMISNTFGSTYLYQSQFDNALKYYFQTFESAKKLQDSVYMANSLNNIGLTYYHLLDFKKALHYLTEALELKRIIGDLSFHTLVNISLCYTNLNNFSKAKSFVSQTLNQCGEGCSTESMMHINFALGVIYLGLKQYDKAETEFLRSYANSIKAHNTRLQFDNIYNLAGMYIIQNRTQEAEYYLHEAEKQIKDGVPFNLAMLNVYSRFYELYSVIGNVKRVAQYQGEYIKLRDSIYNETLTTNLMRIESDYRQRTNVQEIAKQNEVLSLKEQVIVKQQRLNIFGGILTLLLILSVLILSKNIQQKKMMNRLLDEKVICRTRELTETIYALNKSNEYRRLRVQRAISRIQGCLATINGLTNTYLWDVKDQKGYSYVSKIASASEKIGQACDSFKERE